ncbi:MAG TPA: LysR family transcriptional regulator [Candidatus Dormibacteraeota bacterium]|nr:LysR family transcriptional regulator [Candidatus Dormibacteraeota bacterium]
MERQRPPFTLEQLRTFLAVAEHQSITRAADGLGLTRGAVTQQVQLLERSLGVRLLERTGRSLRLSSAGRTVATACRAAARSIEAVTEAARLAATGEVGSVHIGASQTVAGSYLSGPLAAFTARRPKVHLQVEVGSTGRIGEEVELGILDVGCVEAPLPAGSVLSLEIARDEVVMVARPDHPLARGGRIDPGELTGHRLLAREPGSAIDAVARQMLGPWFELIPRLELGALDAVRSAAVAGIGFAIPPRVAVADELADGRLVELDFPIHRRAIYAIRRPAELPPAAEAFWEVLTGGREGAAPDGAVRVSTPEDPARS